MLSLSVRTLTLVICTLLLSCGNKDNHDLLIATSANVQFAMEELVDIYEAETGVKCEIILGSSGKLATQIMQGAPYDVFVSADMFYPHRLREAGFTLDTPKVYARGNLVLWSIKANTHPAISDLERMDRVALANPSTAPYGRAAEQFLISEDLYDRIADRLVFGESISQTNQFIISGTTQAGFTAKSVVLSREMKDKGHWITIPEDRHDPIEQGVVAIRKKKGQGTNATSFVAFLFSESAQEILVKNGYSIP